MLKPPLSPVGHDQKALLPLTARVPLQPTEKPVEGVAPASHCHCVVGGVRIQPRPLESVNPRRMSVEVRTLEWTRIRTAVVDAVLACSETGLANAVLTIRQLVNGAARTTSGGEVEAAGNEMSIGTYV